MTRRAMGIAVLVSWLGVGGTALGQEIGFSASLTGDQETNPVVTDAFGTASLTLNEAQDRLEMLIQLVGLDLDGNQTPEDDQDNVVGVHIHNAPRGDDGGVVFGLISPNSDENDDLIMDPVAGTLFSAWDLTEGNNTTLADQIPALLSAGLYFNVHTPRNQPGEIRGQIVPEPSALVMICGALAAAGFWGRRRGV